MAYEREMIPTTYVRPGMIFQVSFKHWTTLKVTQKVSCFSFRGQNYVVLMPGGVPPKKKNTLDNTQALPRGLPSHQNTYVFDRVNHVYHWLFLCSWVGQFEHFGMCQNHPPPKPKEKDVTEKKKWKKNALTKTGSFFSLIFIDFGYPDTSSRGSFGILHSDMCAIGILKKRWSCWSRNDFRSTRAQWKIVVGELNCWWWWTNCPDSLKKSNLCARKDGCGQRTNLNQRP